MNSNPIKLSLIILLFTIISCGENLNHTIEVVEQNKKYQLKLHNENINTFYELNIKCLNSKSYSPDSVKLLSYRKIKLKEHEQLFLIKNKNGIELQNANRTISKILYPNNASSKIATTTNNRIACSSEYNEIARIKYDVVSDSTKNENHTKILAYSSSPFTTRDEFNWDYFSSNKENLFTIYGGNITCDHKWKTKFNIN